MQLSWPSWADFLLILQALLGWGRDVQASRTVGNDGKKSIIFNDSKSSKEVDAVSYDRVQKIPFVVFQTVDKEHGVNYLGNMGGYILTENGKGRLVFMMEETLRECKAFKVPDDCEDIQKFISSTMRHIGDPAHNFIANVKVENFFELERDLKAIDILDQMNEQELSSIHYADQNEMSQFSTSYDLDANAYEDSSYSKEESNAYDMDELYEQALYDYMDADEDTIDYIERRMEELRHNHPQNEVPVEDDINGVPVEDDIKEEYLSYEDEEQADNDYNSFNTLGN